MRLPNAELPVTWQAAVYRYTASGWVYYKTMYTASGYSAETVSNPVQNVYYQQPMYAGVPDGSYYAVLVYVVPNASLGYQPHYDSGTAFLRLRDRYLLHRLTISTVSPVPVPESVPERAPGHSQAGSNTNVNSVTA